MWCGFEMGLETRLIASFSNARLHAAHLSARGLSHLGIYEYGQLVRARTIGCGAVVVGASRDHKLAIGTTKQFTDDFGRENIGSYDLWLCLTRYE